MTYAPLTFTSRKAAFEYIEANGLLSRRRFQIYQTVWLHGPLTAQETFKRLKIDTNQSGRFTELRDLGVIREHDRARCSVTNFEVTRWVTTDRRPLTREELMAKKSTTRAALHSSETFEWYTPAETISIIRKALWRLYPTSIELDPCSNAVANEVVKAARWFDEWDNGLVQTWKAASVFMNPPYGKDDDTSRSLAEIWIEKFLSEFGATHFGGGVILVNATPDVQWFQELWNGWVSFQKKRIKFWRAVGSSKQPTHGNALIYFGNDPIDFVEAIGDTGHVVPARNVTNEVIDRYRILAEAEAA